MVITCRSYSQVAHTGRWTSERTAKVYIQDSVSLLTTLTFVATPKQKAFIPPWQEAIAVLSPDICQKNGDVEESWLPPFHVSF